MNRTWMSVGILFIACIGGLTGCGPTATGPETGALDREIVIGVSIPAATHGWTGGVNYHAHRTARRLSAFYPNLRFQVTTARDASTQANDLEDLIQIHQIDALVILPFESGPLTEAVRRVHENGVFTVVVDRGLEDPDIQDVYIAGNNPAMGQVAADYIIDQLNGEGDIVVLRGIPTLIDNFRFDAFMERIEGTNIRVLDSQYANWNRDDGFNVMQDFLVRFGKIDAVWAQDDDIALGVIEAVKQAGRAEELFIVGGGGMKDIVERVMNRDRLTPVTVSYPPAMISSAIEVVAMYFVGQAPVAGEYLLDAPLIHPDNAQQHFFPDSPF